MGCILIFLHEREAKHELRLRRSQDARAVIELDFLPIRLVCLLRFVCVVGLWAGGSNYVRLIQSAETITAVAAKPAEERGAGCRVWPA